MTSKDAKYMVPGLERGLRLLSIFKRDNPEMSISEINKHIDLPYATTYRLLYTLESFGLLSKTKKGYMLGSGVLKLGFEYLASLELVDLARPEMIALRDDVGASANLGILDGAEVIYVAHVPSFRALSTRRVAGSRFPAHASSMGRLLLGGMSDDEIRRLYKGVTMQAFGGHAHTIDGLLALVAEARAKGYVISRGIFEPGLVAVAAPILNEQSAVVAAVNVSGASSSLDTGALDGPIKDRVCLAGKRISQLLGYDADQIALRSA